MSLTGSLSHLGVSKKLRAVLARFGSLHNIGTRISGSILGPLNFGSSDLPKLERKPETLPGVFS